jgi:RNA polymerase sigma-70 factor (ECF subfamily)
MSTLRSLLAADVTIHADGGGKRPAAAAPIVGIEEVMQLHSKLAELFVQSMSRLVRYGTINGLPGFVTVEAGDTLQTTALEIIDGRIANIYIMRNPDKLRHIDDGTLH